MPPTAQQGERFRRKHLSLMLGGLDSMTAFKSAVGTTPGRVHPNVVRATPFFANRGPSRRIGTVVNTYALTVRSVDETENRELEKLFFDENAILLPHRLACTACTDGRVKCFARREGAGFVCAASNEAFLQEQGVLQWIAHWRDSTAYDYCGSEAEWLADLDEVIAAMRQSTLKREPERRWPMSNTNADQLVRAGVVGDKDLSLDGAPIPKRELDDSEPPRKRRHVSPETLPRERRESRDCGRPLPAPRRLNDGLHLRTGGGASHNRSVSNTSREHDSLPSPAATSRSTNSPLDAEHRHPHLAIAEGHSQHHSPHHPPMHHSTVSRARSITHPQPQHQSYQPSHPNSHSPPYPPHGKHQSLHSHAHHSHPQPAQYPHGRHSGRHLPEPPSLPSPRPREDSKPPVLTLTRANSPPGAHSRPAARPAQSISIVSATLALSPNSCSQSTSPNVPHGTRLRPHSHAHGHANGHEEIPPRALEYYYTLVGHHVGAMARMRSHEAAIGALNVGLEQMERRKIEMQEELKKHKIEIRDLMNEVRRMREEMLALQPERRMWGFGGGGGGDTGGGGGAGGGGTGAGGGGSGGGAGNGEERPAQTAQPQGNGA